MDGPVPAREFGLERLLFFSDAVFAIAITLLALDIRLPVLEGSITNQSLAGQLLAIWPKYLSFAISFLVIGLFWVNHHRRLSGLRAYDRRLVWLNLLLLMSVAFIPFPTSVISEFGNRTATIFYALAISLAGIFSALLGAYARQKGYLQRSDSLTPRKLPERAGSLAVPGVFLLSIAIAFVNPDLAKFSWFLIVPVIVLLQ